jgi:ATP-dependent Clp protease protease subunit
VKKIDETHNAEDRIDIALLEQSTNFLTGEINEENIAKIIKWVVYENLDARAQTKILTLYVNSPGGDLYQAFALIDVMRNSRHPIRTIGTGLIMSAAFLIFACGSPGKRHIMRNTGIMCHQFSETSEGKFHDIKAAMRESENLNSRMYQILKDATGLDGRVVKNKLLPPTDAYFTADELIALNVADKII